jgi:hypothetical protein
MRKSVSRCLELDKTSSNKNLPIVDALLPNQSKWIFDWFINEAVPGVLDNDAIKKTKIIQLITYFHSSPPIFW